MPVYVYLAYAQAEFPKPMDESGVEKEVDVEEKKKLLMTHIEVSRDDLRHLSMERSENIKAHIIAAAADIQARIFILEPVENKAEEAEDEVSRVKFLLK